MIQVVLQAVFLSSSGLSAVGSITLITLLLLSENGMKKALGYVLGYTGSYALIGICVNILTFQVSGGISSNMLFIFSHVLIFFGILLLYLAFRNWRIPPKEDNEESRFFKFIDSITPRKALGLGILVTIINFKNLMFFLTAQSVIVLSDLSLFNKLLLSLLVVIIFCFSVFVPIILYALFPAKRNEVLIKFREGLNRHRRTISIWGPFVFGLIFLIKGVSELT